MARILLINDEELVRATLRKILETAGHDVVDAADGRVGLERYRENPADVVITDIIMPQMEGIEMILTLKQEYPDAKIIAISGGGEIDKRTLLTWASKIGAQDVLAKPFKSKEIVDAVRRVLVENP